MTTEKKRSIPDYIFTFIIGSLLVYSVNHSIIISTIIQVSGIRLFLTGLFMLTVFVCVFYNRVSMLVTGVVILIAALYIWLTWSDYSDQQKYVSELIQLARGMITYREEYGSVSVYLICGATAFFTAVFLFAWFNIYVLILGGGFTFFLSWRMDYRRVESDFILFIFCFFIILIKYMNTRGRRQNFASLSALIALPLCVITLLFANAAPGMNGAAANPLRMLMEKPLAAIDEFLFEAFHPKYFSFQTTGFSNAGGELGGPVALNAQQIMRVSAPNRIYLSGATMDTYTGKAWINKVIDVQTTVYNQGHFEYLETAAALISETTLLEEPYEGTGDNRLEQLRQYFPIEDSAYINNDDMPYISITTILHNLYLQREISDENDLLMPLNRVYMTYPEQAAGFLRSYLPADVVTIEVINRTGTLFKPAKAWEPNLRQTGGDLENTATGDWRLSNLLDQNAVYSFRYLNPGMHLSFIEDILNRSERGLYERNPLDTGRVAQLYNSLLRRDIANIYDTQTFDSKAAVLFNALYETYHYADSAGPLNEAFSDNVNVLIPSGRNVDNPLQYQDFANIVKAMNNALDDYSDSIYENFTALPENLPRRVHDLAYELTEGCTTDYRRVKAIEDYLITYPYTLTPENLPIEADFVDHFLFDGKEGYCTYYASAMAVLARCLGIPSRYTEGYVLPGTRDEDGLFTVTNQQAHAWAEVYLEGYGWLALEPTAPYHSTMANPGTAADLNPSMYSPGYLQEPDYLEYMQRMGFDSAYLGNLPNAATSSRSFIEVLQAILPWLALIPITFTVFVLCFILIQRIREAFRFYKVKHMEINEQACAFFRGILKIAVYYNYPLKNGETSYMYCEKLGRRFTFKSDTLVMLDLVKLYYKACYGSKTITEAELNTIRECYYEIVDFLIRMRRRPHYMYLRYVRRVTVI